MSKFRRFVVKARGFFRDNVVPLAFIIAVVWLGVVWISFLQGDIKLETLTAYAMFGTALVTLLVAVATYLVARETRASRKLNEAMIKENRKLAEAPRIRELIIRVINPLLESVASIGRCHEKREYEWIRPDLERAKELLGNEQEALIFQIGVESASFPYPRLTIKEISISHQLNQALYRDFRNMHPSLTERIGKADREVVKKGFERLLLDLAKEIFSPELRRKVETWLEPENQNALQELTLSTERLAFNELMGTSEEFLRDQIDTRHRNFWVEHKDSIMEGLTSRNIKDKVEQITKEARSFANELKSIETELTQIKNGYQQEYHLTHEETKGEGIE